MCIVSTLNKSFLFVFLFFFIEFSTISFLFGHKRLGGLDVDVLCYEVEWYSIKCILPPYNCVL